MLSEVLSEVFPQVESPPAPVVTGGNHILPKGTGNKGVLSGVKMTEGRSVHCQMGHGSYVVCTAMTVLQTHNFSVQNVKRTPY